MPDDLAPYHRIAFALALALATTKVKTELDVVSSAMLLRSRAITREFVNELGIIRRSAQTRLLAIAAGAVAFAAATKPYTSEKAFLSVVRATLGETAETGNGRARDGGESRRVVSRLRAGDNRRRPRRRWDE